MTSDQAHLQQGEPILITACLFQHQLITADHSKYWGGELLGFFILFIVHFHHFHLIVIFFLYFWNISQLQLTKCPSASAVVVALGDVNRFTWTWMPVNNPGRANQVTKEGQIAKSGKYVLIVNRKVNVCLVQIGCQW